jgi:hypothetical protein
MKIYTYMLPQFEAFDPSHPQGEAIPIEQLKPYLRQYGAIFGVDRQTREEAKDCFFTNNNVGANYSFDSPQELNAITVLGFDALQTIHIDVHLTDDFPLLALMLILSYTHRLKHIYLSTFTGLSKMVPPTIDEDADEVGQFLTRRGDLFKHNLLQIQDIHIDFVTETDFSSFEPHVGKFIQLAWMNQVFDSDTPLTILIKRALFVARPSVQLSTASDSKTYSDRDLEDDLD